ncbi:hypothetical protein [Actinomyces israelii]|uniref:hypothetical protein n=1 Tax=Actinomyces israelii TaxID=1659 RepID=UPI0025560F26|nr:hypothetical protein [Actinomyces israelii]
MTAEPPPPPPDEPGPPPPPPDGASPSSTAPDLVAAGAQGRPAPPPPSRALRRPRLGRRGRAAVAAVLVLVIVLAGVGAWALARSGGSRTHRRPPAVQATLDLSGLGEHLAPAPIDSGGSVVLASGQMRVLRVVEDGREALVGVDLSSASGYPVWQVPVPDELAGRALSCQYTQEAIDCGDLLSIDPSTGVNTAGPVTVPAAAPASPDATPGAAGGQPPAPDSAFPAPPTASVQLGESASEDTPLAVSPDGSLTAGGKTIRELTFDGPVWAARIDMPRTFAGMTLPMTRRVWVVSDGATMAGLDGSSLLWSGTLPDGVAALNGLGAQDPPRWLVAKGAIVIAHPDAIVAIDPMSGSTVWQADGTVTSWSASGDAIVVVNGSTASLLSFGKGSVPATATALPSSAPTGDTAPAPDLEDMKGSTLEVPDLCKTAGSQDPATGKTMAAFVDGVATGSSAVGAPPTATMTALRPGVFDGSPVAITVLRCYGGGNTVFDVVAAYDSDKTLIGSVDHVVKDDIGESPDLVVKNLRSVGNTLVYTVPGIKVAGDAACHACEGSAEATVTDQWDGDSLEITDVLYRLPSGAVRIPSAQDVQTAYDAIASDDRAVEDELVEPKALNALDQHLGAGQNRSSTARAVQFPTGGRVVGCALAGPSGSPYSTNGSGRASAPGDIICPVTTDDPTMPWLHPRPDGGPGRGAYASWLILRADETGKYQVVDIGRAFA